MKYGTVCSGIEAPSAAWGPLGWKAQWFSEIEKFPRAVLAHHYPTIPDLGDMTEVDWRDQQPIDLLIGGTPCQSFSVAGLRKGLDDSRGNLALEFLRIVSVQRPRWLVWENVPGVLSSNGGRDFGSFLGAVAKLGYGFFYRVLDAQFFGVPQRRRRVFVIGCLGNWTGPAAVLFEPESVFGNPPACRRTRPEIAALTAAGVGTCGADDNQAQAGRLIAGTLGEAGGNMRPGDTPDGAASGYLQPIAFHARQNPIVSDVMLPLEAQGGQAVAIATESAVRRLTPRECERLQGFPDDYTLVPAYAKGSKKEDREEVARWIMASDPHNWTLETALEWAGHPNGPRYKALGNSMAVPVIRWLGQRIQFVDDLLGGAG